jgi:hypothetical protein
VKHLQGQEKILILGEKPKATVETLLNFIANQNPPQRVLFGKIAYHVLNEVYTKRLDEIQNWKEVSIAAHGH